MSISPGTSTPQKAAGRREEPHGSCLDRRIAPAVRVDSRGAVDLPEEPLDGRLEPEGCSCRKDVVEEHGLKSLPRKRTAVNVSPTPVDA